MPVDGGHRREYTEKSSGVVFGHVLGAVLPMMRHFGEHREAVDGGWAMGIDWVELAERQHEATMEDLAWALSD